MADWRDEAIVLGARRFGETDAIADVFTRQRGRASGLVYGGAGKRKKPLLEPGTVLDLTWRARSDAALGFFETLEPVGPGPAILVDDPAALLALGAMAAILRDSIVEHQAHPGLFEATEVLLGLLETRTVWPAAYIRWELGVLAETGYGLDLTVCALSGVHDDLAWVSPKTGKAASREAGAPWADRLLVLPPFLADPRKPVASGDVADGFALAAHFLTRDLLAPVQRELPEARYRLINALARDGRL